MRSLAALAGALVLAGCSGPGATPADPGQDLKEAASAMSGLSSVTADVKFGAGVAFQGFTLQSATARLARNGDSDTTIKVKQNDFLVDLRVVTTGGNVYLKIPFSAFQQLTPAQAAEVPDLSALLDSKRGLPSVLPLGQSPHDAGHESIAGVDCVHIDTVYTAAQAGAALGGFKPAGDIKAGIWIGSSDHRVRRVILAGPLVEAARSTTVQVDLRDFNTPLTVTPPAA